MHLILNIDSGMNNIDLLPLQKYVSWHNLNAWFPMTPGENHHQLLAYLSSQLPAGSLVSDLGTQYGASALSLSHNQTVAVETYDVADCIPAGVPSFRDRRNIRGVCADCFACVDNISKSQIVLLDISPHNGSDERRMLGMLLEREYKGLLICDDIYYSESMTSFWNEVKLKKHDVTCYGHFSGTGIIIFDPATLDIRVT